MKVITLLQATSQIMQHSDRQNPVDERLRIGDPVKLKDTTLDLRGDVWELRTGRYCVVRWEDECRSTHRETALEYDYSRARTPHRAK